MSQDFRISQITNLLQALRKRGESWPVIRDILRNHDLNPGQGWDRAIASIQRAGMAHSDQINGARQALTEMFESSIWFNGKTVRYFLLEESQHLALSSHIEDCAYAPVDFLIDIQQEPDDQEVASNPQPICVSKGCYPSIAFRVIREFTERTSVDIPESVELADHAWLRSIASYTELIAVKKTRQKFYDVVRIHPIQCEEGNRRSSLIEIAVDAGSGLSVAESQAASSTLVGTINQILIDRGVPALPQHPLNLFSAVAGLYHLADGRVSEIGFACQEGATHREVARRARQDIRATGYHVGGTNAATIDLFSVGMAWKRQNYRIEYDCELLIGGSVRMLSQPTPTIVTATLSQCINESDHQFLTEKLMRLVANG